MIMLALVPGYARREARVAEYPDINGHYLKREWRRYERLSRRDRPEKEIALLTFIKEQAAEEPAGQGLLRCCGNYRHDTGAEELEAAGLFEKRIDGRVHQGRKTHNGIFIN